MSSSVTYFSQNTLFLCDICNYRSHLFIASAGHLGTQEPLITFNNIPALQVSDYRESGKPLRGLAYCFVFQVYHFTHPRKLEQTEFLSLPQWVDFLSSKFIHGQHIFLWFLAACRISATAFHRGQALCFVSIIPKHGPADALRQSPDSEAAYLLALLLPPT